MAITLCPLEPVEWPGRPKPYSILMKMNYTIICPNCGYDTGIDPALVDPDAPMMHCLECDKELFDPEINPL